MALARRSAASLRLAVNGSFTFLLGLRPFFCGPRPQNPRELSPASRRLAAHRSGRARACGTHSFQSVLSISVRDLRRIGMARARSLPLPVLTSVWQTVKGTNGNRSDTAKRKRLSSSCRDFTEPPPIKLLAHHRRRFIHHSSVSGVVFHLVW